MDTTNSINTHSLGLHCSPNSAKALPAHLLEIKPQSSGSKDIWWQVDYMRFFPPRRDPLPRTGRLSHGFDLPVSHVSSNTTIQEHLEFLIIRRFQCRITSNQGTWFKGKTHNNHCMNIRAFPESNQLTRMIGLLIQSK